MIDGVDIGKARHSQRQTLSGYAHPDRRCHNYQSLTSVLASLKPDSRVGRKAGSSVDKKASDAGLPSGEVGVKKVVPIK